MEGLALGIPSIAILVRRAAICAPISTHLRAAGAGAHAAAARISRRLPRFPPNTLLNVNLPPRAGRRCTRREAHATRPPRLLAVRHADEGSVGAPDLLDRRRRRSSWTGEPDSDFRAIQEGYVSVTPLHLDLTHFGVLEGAETWWRGSCRAARCARRAASTRRDAAREGDSRSRRAARVRADAAPRVRADRAAPSRVRGRAAADRQRADDLAAVGPRALPRAARSSRARSACSRSARAPATRRCCSRTSWRRSSRSSASRRCSSRRARTSSARASNNVSLLLGDGTVGWREYAPYDAILVERRRAVGAAAAASTSSPRADGC